MIIFPYVNNSRPFAIVKNPFDVIGEMTTADRIELTEVLKHPLFSTKAE